MSIPFMLSLFVFLVWLKVTWHIKRHVFFIIKNLGSAVIDILIFSITTINADTFFRLVDLGQRIKLFYLFPTKLRLIILIKDRLTVLPHKQDAAQIQINSFVIINNAYAADVVCNNAFCPIDLILPSLNTTANRLCIRRIPNLRCFLRYQ